MPVVDFNNVGKRGIIRDTPAKELPATTDDFAWSDGQNVRFIDNQISRFEGQTLRMTASAQPVWLMWVQNNYQNTSERSQWLYDHTGGLRLHTRNPSTGNTIVEVSLCAGLWLNNTRQTGCQINQWAVVAPQVEGTPIQLRVGLTATPSAGRLVYDLTAAEFWNDGTAGLQGAKVIRRYKNFLVALEPREQGVGILRDTVWWSTDAGSDEVPITWDITRTDENAGRTTLDGGGKFVDLFELRENAIIYKEYQTWLMRFIGGNDVFSFERLFTDRGMLHRDCCAVVDDRHIVFGADDIYIHDGVRAQSLLDKRQRRHIFSRLIRTGGGGRPAVVQYNQRDDEVWIAYRITDNGPTLNSLMVYNVQQDTISERDLHVSTRYFAAGPLYVSGTTNTVEAGPHSIMMCGGEGLHTIDDAFTMNGTLMTSYVQRTGIDLGEPSKVKMVRKVWPRTTTDDAIEVRVGSQMNPRDAITWSDYKSFNPTTSEELDFDVKGRYLAIEFRSSATTDWGLSGFSMDVRLGGKY